MGLYSQEQVIERLKSAGKNGVSIRHVVTKAGVSHFRVKAFLASEPYQQNGREIKVKRLTDDEVVKLNECLDTVKESI